MLAPTDTLPHGMFAPKPRRPTSCGARPSSVLDVLTFVGVPWARLDDGNHVQLESAQGAASSPGQLQPTRSVGNDWPDATAHEAQAALEGSTKGGLSPTMCAQGATLLLRRYNIVLALVLYWNLCCHGGWRAGQSGSVGGSGSFGGDGGGTVTGKAWATAWVAKVAADICVSSAL